MNDELYACRSKAILFQKSDMFAGFVLLGVFEVEVVLYGFR